VSTYYPSCQQLIRRQSTADTQSLLLPHRPPPTGPQQQSGPTDSENRWTSEVICCAHTQPIRTPPPGHFDRNSVLLAEERNKPRSRSQSNTRKSNLSILAQPSPPASAPQPWEPTAPSHSLTFPIFRTLYAAMDDSQDWHAVAFHYRRQWENYKIVKQQREGIRWLPQGHHSDYLRSHQTRRGTIRADFVALRTRKRQRNKNRPCFSAPLPEPNRLPVRKIVQVGIHGILMAASIVSTTAHAGRWTHCIFC